SMLRALYRLLTGEHPPVPDGAALASDEGQARFGGLKNLPAAYFVWGGARTPLTVDYLVPNSSDLSAEARSLVAEAIAGWGEAARALGLRPWLAYMPCKRRVLDGFLASTEGAPLPAMLSDLVEFVRGLAAG